VVAYEDYLLENWPLAKPGFTPYRIMCRESIILSIAELFHGISSKCIIQQRSTGITKTLYLTMIKHFKTSGFPKALLFAALVACFTPRAQAQEVVTGASNSFGVLGGSSVSATASPGSVIGDVGVSPGSAITLGGMTVTGNIYANIPPATTAHTDAQTAYNQMLGFAVTPVVGVLTGQDLGGKTLAPGVYMFSSSAQLTGVLTLSGAGQYIFQIASTLTTASGASVNLINGANASDVFFQVGSSATLGTDTSFQGSIYALQSGTMVTGSTINGRFVTLNGALTLDANTITNTDATSDDLIVNATTFDLGASRNEQVSSVLLSNAGQILGTGTSSLQNTGNYNLQDGLVTAILSGNGSALNKTTNGTVTLSGANTYTGGTTISAGTLVANNLAGSATGTGPVTVASGATLIGNGTVGNVTVNTGGILVPGSSGLGNLTTSTLTLANGSVTNFNFNGTANTQLAATGTNGLTLGNGAVIDLYQTGTTTPFITLGTYQLISYVGTVTGAAAALTIGTPSNGLNFTFNTTGGLLDVTIAVASGPGSWSASGNGNWSNTANWASGVVGAGSGNTAIFGTSITTPATVTLDGNETVGGLTFGNANAYTIALGTGALTLNNLGATSVIAVSLGNETISVPLILTAGGMTAQLSANTSLTINGNISQTAPAGVTKAGLGSLTLSGTNNTYTGDTVITGGTLTDGVSNAIPSASNLTVNGTTAVFNLGANHTNTVNIVSLDGNGSITGTGNSTLTSTGGFQLMNGTVTAILAGNGSALNKTTNGTVTLSGVNTYTGNTTVTAGTLTDGVSNAIPSASNLTVNGTTAVFNLGANHTNTVNGVTLNGNGSILGTGNSTLTSTGGFQVMNGTVTAILAGNGSALNKTTNGTVTLAGANTYTGATNVTAGTLVVSSTGSLPTNGVLNVAAGAVFTENQNGTIATLNNNGLINGNGTLTATTYNLGNGSQINTSLGNGTLISNGNVGVNSTIASTNISIQSGTMTLQQPNLLSPNATANITNGATLVLGNGNTSILGLDGNGTVNDANGILNVIDGFGTFNGTVTGATGTNGTLTSNGNLTIAFGTNSFYPNGTLVTGGTLTVNGTLTTSNVTVDPAGTLGGNGTIIGNVIQNGGIVAPNDPSITHVSGNYTINSGTLQIDIAGTGGPGVNPNGNDQVQVGGKTSINPVGTVLALQSGNGFTSPARGDTFTFISGAPGSISGYFGTVTSNFTTDLMVDIATGQAIGTGMPAGTSLANTFPGATANQIAMLNSLQVANHEFAGGDLLALLLSNPASADAQIFNQSSPEAYAGVTDYALYTTRSFLDTAMSLSPMASSGEFAAFAGYTDIDPGSDSSSNQGDYTINSSGAVAGVRFDVGQKLILGAYEGYDSGSMDSTYLNTGVSGNIYGVFATFDPLASHRLLLNTSISYGNYTTHGTRNTFSGVSTIPSFHSDDYLADVNLQYVAIQQPKYSVVPEIGLAYSRATVDGVNETNNADPLEALQINSRTTPSLRLDGSVNTIYHITNQFSVNGSFGVSHDFDTTSRDVSASVVGDPDSFSVQAPGMGDTDYDLGVGLQYDVTKQLSLHANYEAGFSTQAKMSNTFSVGASFSF